MLRGHGGCGKRSMGTEILKHCLTEIGRDRNEGEGMIQGLEVGDTGYERTA